MRKIDKLRELMGRVAFAVLLSNITLINNHLQNTYFLRVSGRTAKISKNTVF